MPLEQHDCGLPENVPSTEVPPPHFWVCCGFNELPNAFQVTWGLIGTVSGTPEDYDKCVELWGEGEHVGSLSRKPCSSLYYSNGIPFYFGSPSFPICSTSPRGANNHVGAWGFGIEGPGATYDLGDACGQNPETGAITFSRCITGVIDGNGCKFRACAALS